MAGAALSHGRGILCGRRNTFARPSKNVWQVRHFRSAGTDASQISLARARKVAHADFVAGATLSHAQLGQNRQNHLLLLMNACRSMLQASESQGGRGITSVWPRIANTFANAHNEASLRSTMSMLWLAPTRSCLHFGKTTPFKAVEFSARSILHPCPPTHGSQLHPSALAPAVLLAKGPAEHRMRRTHCLTPLDRFVPSHSVSRSADNFQNCETIALERQWGGTDLNACGLRTATPL